MEGVQQPRSLGDENDPYGYEPRIRPSWDDPPSLQRRVTQEACIGPAIRGVDKAPEGALDVPGRQ